MSFASAPSALHQPVPSALWLGVVGVGIAMTVSVLFPCACGHLQPRGLPLSLSAVALTAYAMVRHGAPRLALRAVADTFVTLAALVLFKNVADVCWFGHSPIFARPAQAALQAWSRALIAGSLTSLSLLALWTLSALLRRRPSSSR